MSWVEIIKLFAIAIGRYFSYKFSPRKLEEVRLRSIRGARSSDKKKLDRLFYKGDFKEYQRQLLILLDDFDIVLAGRKASSK